MKKEYVLKNLELVNATLRRNVQELEQKVARYEQLLRRCPKFRMTEEETAKSVCTKDWLVVPEEPFHQDPDRPNIYCGNYRPSASPVSGTLSEDDDFDEDFEEDFDDDFDEDFEEDDDWFDDEVDWEDTDASASSSARQAFPHVRTFHRLLGK